MDNCRHVTALTVAADSSVLNPQKWACQICGTTESVWVCLNSLLLSKYLNTSDILITCKQSASLLQLRAQSEVRGPSHM